MTGVQTCALPICFPVTICEAIDYNVGSFIDQNKNYSALSGGSSTANKLTDNTGGQFRWYVNAIVDAVKVTESYAKMKEKRKGDESNKSF